jgi:hypothetical protein
MWNAPETIDAGVNPNNDHSPRFQTSLYEATQCQIFLWSPDESQGAGVIIRKELRYKDKFYPVFAVYSCCDFKTSLKGCGGRMNEWDEDYKKVLAIADVEIIRLEQAGWTATPQEKQIRSLRSYIHALQQEIASKGKHPLLAQQVADRQRELTAAQNRLSLLEKE